MQLRTSLFIAEFGGDQFDFSTKGCLEYVNFLCLKKSYNLNFLMKSLVAFLIGSNVILGVGTKVRPLLKTSISGLDRIV